MGANTPLSSHTRPIRFTCLLGALVSLLLGLVGCEPSGDSTLVSPSPAPTSQTEAQAIDNLLDLYSEALRQEDIDRLQALLRSEPMAAASTRQGAEGTFADLVAFRDGMATTFRSHTVTHHAILPNSVDIADDHTHVSFVEVESLADPVFRFHHSRIYQTTLMLQRTTTAETVQFRIHAVQRDGPIAEITTQGQTQTNLRSRVTVAASSGQFTSDHVDIVDPVTGEMRTLRVTGTGFVGAFTPSERVSALSVQLHDSRGPRLEVAHPYRARGTGDYVVERIPGTGGTRLLAIAMAPDGVVWTGGDQGASLYQVTPGASQAQQVQSLLSDAAGRIDDLVIDALGRLHVVVFSPQRSGVIVRHGDTFCQTVNVLDDTYPLRDAAGQPSVSTRAVAASNGTIWLLGSDAGVVQVSDGFHDGQCPATDVEVQYANVLRRENHVLPVNTVPALEIGHDGALWVGSALGLGRLKDGQLTRIAFDPVLSFQGEAATLEMFFQNVAQAIFESRPVESVAVGEVSFVEAFGSPLVKEDLIFSLTEDHLNRLWIGTLGGGVRRVEVHGDAVEQTLHVTRQDGLASNVIFSLAEAPEGAVWTATDDGVSRIETNGEQVAITTYGVLDGLELPVRDIAIDDRGTVWVATDGGLFRLQSSQGRMVGQVHNASGQPVVEAEVVVHGASVRTVTDAEGRFEIGGIPPGQYLLEVDGSTSASGVYGSAFRDITVATGEQTRVSISLTPPGLRGVIDVEAGGVITFANVPGAALEVPPASAHFPAGETPAIGLTRLPVGALSRPLPSGFDGVVVAQLAPSGLRFTSPARLSLPNPGQVEAGQLLILMCLDETTGVYEQLGLGRVSADGAVIEALSGGLTSCSTVAYATTASDDAIRLFLLPVSGNNQRVAPGQAALAEPMVVRLEDQFGNQVAGEVVTAAIIQGDWRLVDESLVTDAQGEARFEARTAGTDSGADFVVQITAPNLANVRPVQFFAIVGEIDTPGSPRGLAVADEIVYLADFGGGLQVIDVRNPMQPKLLHRNVLGQPNGIFTPAPDRQTVFASSIATQGARVYLGTGPAPPQVYIFDIRNVHDLDWPMDRNADRLPDSVLGVVDFPANVDAHRIVDIALQGSLAYVISNTFSSDLGNLYVIDVRDPTQPQVISSTPLPTPDPSGVAVMADVVYVAAEHEGFLVYDVSNPTEPTRIAMQGYPELNDDEERAFVSRIGLVEGLAYVVERRRHRATQQIDDYLTVIDVRTPTMPQRRGSIQLKRQPQNTQHVRGLSVSGPFAYVVRGAFGLEALDVRNPDAPRRVGFVQTPGEAWEVTADGSLLYASVQVFGLQVIQGPGARITDTDNDGIADFFDAFPTDPTETQDSDGDRLGDHVDPDDDNDEFTDAEEVNAIPPSDPTDPRQFPFRLPPAGQRTLIVDATTTVTARERNGAPDAPYRALTVALRAVKSGQAPDVHTIHVQPGLYTSLTTLETYPLDLGGLTDLTIQAADAGAAVLNAEFQSDVISAESSRDLVITGFDITNGATGVSVIDSTGVTIHNNHIRSNISNGIDIRRGGQGNLIQDNLIEGNGRNGIVLLDTSPVTITRNIVRDNGDDGMEVALDAHAEIRENLFERNFTSGIGVTTGATGVVAQNTVRNNDSYGLRITLDAHAEAIDNTFANNKRCGITVGLRSTAVIRGGLITLTRTDPTTDATRQGNGVCVRRPGDRELIHGLPGATIGLGTGAILEITRNEGAGIFVADDGSKAQIDSRNLIFSDNAGGDTVGNVIDVAP